MKHLIFLIFLLLCSCITKNNSRHIKQIKIVKFMGVDTYATDIDKEMFWTYDEEHMFLFMKKAGFLSDIETYQEEKQSSVKEYTYAFITPTKDTLYSDYSLKSWILIRNNNKKYFYDKSGKTAIFLKRYPFFRDCPYIPNDK